jgi:DNA-binding LacI/PurR family transcriptional regulator
VPHDVSVATVAAPRVADLAMPALTCVPFPSAELGFHAASVLVRALDDRAAGIPPRAEHVLLPATVSVRETTAPPRPPTTEEGVP